MNQDDDYDAEFERFLQESLSSSGVSHLSRSNSGIANRNFGLSSLPRSNSGAGLSDQELEMKGTSWLRSSNPLVDSLLPSIGESKFDNYSRDSLDASKNDHTKKPSKLETAYTSSSTDEESGVSESYAGTHKPGLDTLEENEDKNRFFAELEKGRDTPVDYSELNKKLHETGKSTATSSASHLEEVASQYTDDFESLSTRDGVSSGGSSNTITQDHMGLGTSLQDSASKQHGFFPSPIHTGIMYASDLQLSDSNSSIGSHLKSESETPEVDPTGLSMKSESETPPTELSMKSESKTPKVAPTGLSMKSDSRLLKGRASKPSLLNSKQSPVVSAPTSSILPQESAEGGKSNDSSHSSFSDPKFTPLAPLSDHRVVPSDMARKVESAVIDNRDKDTSVLKPLETDSALVKPNEVDSTKPPLGWDGQKHNAHMLTSVSSDIPSLVPENDIQLQPGRRLSNVMTSSLHQNSTAVDTLTAVTDIADSSIAGVTDSQLAEVQSALVAAGLSQIDTTHQKPDTPTHFQPSTGNVAEELCVPSHEGGVDAVSNPAKDLTYESLNIQELIRAITSEEITSAGKEILEGTPMQKLPPPPKIFKRALKLKPKAVDTSIDRSGFKAKQTGMSKQRAQLSSSRESLGSRSDSSSRKQAPHSRTKMRTSGKDNSARTTAQASTKKSKLPRKSDKEAVKTNVCHKQSQKVPSLTPRACHSPAERLEESKLLSNLLGIEADTPRREEPFVKEFGGVVAGQLAGLEQEFQQREAEMKAQHESEVDELKQELFSQAVKLKDVEMALNSRKLLASGKSPDQLISHDEKLALQREIKEQEVLLQGYQKENERVCAELASLQQEAKASLGRLYQENQQLTSELATAKARPSQRHPLAESTPRQPGLDVASVQATELAEQAAAQIAELEDKLERESSEKRDLQNQVKQLKHLSHTLEQELRAVKLSNKDLHSTAHQRLNAQVEKLKKKHLDEIAQLTEKLSGYVDKQKLLENTVDLLESREAEISSLKEKLAAAAAAAASSSVDAKPKSAPPKVSGSRGRPSEVKRIQQLEKQVKELEKVIQKRFPNSMSALILAANSSTELELEHSKVAAEARIAELEGTVKELRDALESCQRESERKCTALQHKYADLQMKYEQQATSLNRQVTSTATPPKPHQGNTKRGDLTSWQASPPNTHERRVDPRTVATHDGSPAADMAAIVQENSSLKEKLSEVSFELAHQRVQLQGKLAEAERMTTLAQEEAQRRVSQLEEDHKCKVDSLLAKFARESSQLEVSRLHTQLKAKEATIVHLREQTECLEYDANKLSESKAREEKLVDQLKTTSEELLEARRSQAPEMHHFMLLQAKIASLEERNRDFEAKHKLSWQNKGQTSDASIKEIEHKWRCVVLAKNAEIEQYREELDSLLAALRVLQQQGSSA